MAAINPQRIRGRWIYGVALDIHTIRSTYIGVNEHGHDVFDTVRSDLGELLVRLKLLFDDLFRSGATMNAVTDVLTRQGKAASVRALTITRTRSNQ